MTYANAKKLFTFPGKYDDPAVLSYLIGKITDKYSFPHIIFITGKYSYATGAFLASALEKSTYRTARCSEYFAFEPYEILGVNGKHIRSDILCKYIEHIVSVTSDGFPDMIKGRDFIKRFPVSERSAALILSLLYSSDEKCDFLIFECEDTGYFEHIASKYISSPLLTILADTDSEKILSNIPDKTSECICYSKENNYDYISNVFTPSGTHLNFVSDNKIMISNTTPLGTDFFYNSDMFSTKITEKKFILAAAFAIEGANALDRNSIPIPTACIFKAMCDAKNPFDFVFYSHYPTIICKAVNRYDTKESINNSLSELRKVFKNNIKIFLIPGSIENLPSDYKYYNYNKTFCLRKNISEFIKSNAGFPLLFIGNINSVSMIKKELEMITFLHRK